MKFVYILAKKLRTTLKMFRTNYSDNSISTKVFEQIDKSILAKQKLHYHCFVEQFFFINLLITFCNY